MTEDDKSTKIQKNDSSAENRKINESSSDSINEKSSESSNESIDKKDRDNELLPYSGSGSIFERTTSLIPKKNNRKNQSRQNNTNNKAHAGYQIAEGYKLEYRMKRLLFHLGYYTRIGIDVRTSTDENSDKITDLDVYGIYFHKDFTSKSTWVDCKSGGVEIHKRISWIKGIMHEFPIDDVIFVVTGGKKTRTSVKQYARKSGILILDTINIENLEKYYNIKSNDLRGSWNPNTQFNKINLLSSLELNSNVFKKIARFIASDFWILDCYTQSKRTITALKELASALDLPLSPEQRNVISWAIYETTCLLLLSLLNISKELYYLSDSEKTETLYDGMISSDIPNKRRAEMFDTAFKVAYGVVKNHYPDLKLPEQMPTINMSPPTYFEALNDLVLRVTNNPLAYYDLLRFLDFTFMEYDLQNKDIDKNELEKIFANYSEIIVGAKTLLNFICHVTKIPRSFFKMLIQQISS